MLKIRLKRKGRKKRPFWYIVAADSKRSRNGLHYKKLGYFSCAPIHSKMYMTIALDFHAFMLWLGKPAKVNDSVFNVLSYTYG